MIRVILNGTLASPIQSCRIILSWRCWLRVPHFAVGGPAQMHHPPTRNHLEIRQEHDMEIRNAISYLEVILPALFLKYLKILQFIQTLVGMNPAFIKLISVLIPPYFQLIVCSCLFNGWFWGSRFVFTENCGSMFGWTGTNAWNSQTYPS